MQPVPGPPWASTPRLVIQAVVILTAFSALFQCLRGPVSNEITIPVPVAFDVQTISHADDAARKLKAGTRGLPGSDFRLIQAASQGRRCMHGGLELPSGGCVCGRHTRGDACEELTVADEEKARYQVCGPNCLPIFVWYPTDVFKFRPIDRQNKDDKDIRGMLDHVLAWRDGGEIRGSTGELWWDGVHSGATSTEGDEGQQAHEGWLRRMATTFGPWSEADKVMLRSIAGFKSAQARGDIAPPDPIEMRWGVRIVFGIMVHDNLPRFRALWDVMFNEEHFYIIHIDRQQEKEDGSAEDTASLRQGVISTIEATKVNDGSVWDRVIVIDEDRSVKAVWGDITLVYNEVMLWLTLLHHGRKWTWDYFINLSSADIPLMSMSDIAKYLEQRSPRSFIWYHDNTEEFRQTYVMPPKRHRQEVVVFNALQNSTAHGRYREAVGITRLYGCSQWHVLHRRMVHALATTPEILGLLFSLKATAIPDESFFGTAGVWLHKREPDRLPLERSDLRYSNERFHRDLSENGELRAIRELGSNRQTLFARKSNSAIVTCAYTNRILGLNNDCSRYKETGEFPADAIPEASPRRKEE